MLIWVCPPWAGFTIAGDLGDKTVEAEEYQRQYLCQQRRFGSAVYSDRAWQRAGRRGHRLADLHQYPGAGGFTNLSGALAVWEQQPIGKAPYPLGFTNMYSSQDAPATDICRPCYVPPLAGHDIANFGATTITLSGGDLPASVVTAFTLNPTTDTVAFTGANPNSGVDHGSHRRRFYRQFPGFKYCGG